MKYSRKTWLVLFLCLLTMIVLAGCREKATVVEVQSPEGLTVEKGVSSSSLELPAELNVKLSNGQSAKRPVVWDKTWLPDKLDVNVSLKGQVQGGLAAEIAIKVTDKPTPIAPQQLPCISTEEAGGSRAVEAMEAVLGGLQELAMAPSWSRHKDTVAFVLDHEILYIWKAGEPECKEVANIGNIVAEMEWSYDDRYLWVDVGTSPARGCVIVDVAEGEVVEVLEIAEHAKWAPNCNVLLVGLFNREVLLPWRCPEHAVDLAIYDVENRNLQQLIAATTEYEFRAVAWDGPKQVIYEKHHFADKRIEQGLIYGLDK